MRTIIYKIDSVHDGIKTETFLMREHGVSRRLLTRLKRMPAGITINGIRARTVDILHFGDILEINMEDIGRLEGNPQLFVPVVYEDEDVIVFNKPVGMPVHPSMKHQGDTLGNYFASIRPELSFRPINRLDRDTSGLCAVAKNAHAANILQSNINKVYYAVVCGSPPLEGIIDAPIARAEESVILRCVREDGQRAVTGYTVMETNGKYSLVRVRLETGRTHQIRVHFSYIGYPLAGDDMYSGDCTDISAQALHCKEISFLTVSGRDRIFIDSDIRTDMLKLLDS